MATVVVKPFPHRASNSGGIARTPPLHHRRRAVSGRLVRARSPAVENEGQSIAQISARYRLKADLGLQTTPNTALNHHSTAFNPTHTTPNARLVSTIAVIPIPADERKIRKIHKLEMQQP